LSPKIPGVKWFFSTSPNAGRKNRSARAAKVMWVIAPFRVGADTVTGLSDEKLL